MRGILRLIVDDSGQDLVEYALLSGVIGVAGILLFPVIAGKMGTAYSSWRDGVNAVWQPSPPCGC